MELSEEARAVVDLRRAEHPWTEIVGAWLDGRADKPTFVTAAEIYTTCLSGSPKDLDRRKQTVIAGVMRSLGWTPDVQRVGDGKRPTRGYCPVGHKPAPAPTEKKTLDSLASLY